jgi:uncharacterized membrane protein YdjX (TVP38/TMEM64 family)
MSPTGLGALTARWARPLALLAVVATGVAAALAVGVPSIDEVRATVDSAGSGAPVLYVLLYAALTLTPTPATLTSITAGVLFGLPLGLLVVLAGAVTGSAVGFGLARVLGRDAVRALDSQQLQRLDGLLRRRGLIAVIGIRLVPLPFAAVNYACGLSALRLRDYLLGTAVGILPGATAYVTVGAFGATPGSVPFLLAVAGVAALTLVGAALVRPSRRTTSGGQPLSTSVIGSRIWKVV